MKLKELTQDQQRKLVEFRAGHVDGRLPIRPASGAA